MTTGNLVLRLTLWGQQTQQLTRRKWVRSELIWTAVGADVNSPVHSVAIAYMPFLINLCYAGGNRCGRKNHGSPFAWKTNGGRY